ncbi:concanavalin A-like lectin/glucanase domain-containing protein [Thelonectria olida]|uniref:Concanavalin A-like lectin/glucanase domain-containing protein n=1 Tax=Thelonectria olida TaxID=1576542 RepID=A0A9P8VU92_9HYPO|nr:concanavalin A-like lectin/glucanase domain-containing protein [Thelonectria olida]
MNNRMWLGVPVYFLPISLTYSTVLWLPYLPCEIGISILYSWISYEGTTLRFNICPVSAHAGYALETTYDFTNFFSEFDFFDEPDPTKGYVEYVNAITANEWGLAKYQNNLIYMGGLFIADIAHMPGSICGVWPAMWLYGPDWPASGEIDIIEGINSQTSNIITLHTSPGCTMSNDDTANSTVLNESNCHVGCSQSTGSASNYGTNFNRNGGGTYAVEWTSSHISVWFFPRSAIPSDIVSQKPNPSSWGQPIACFNGDTGCDIGKHFQNNRLVFDTTFCGSWAGVESVWENDVTCSAKTQGKTCMEFVAANPSEFAEAHWLIRSIKIYQQGSNFTSSGKHIPNRSFVPKPFRL